MPLNITEQKFLGQLGKPNPQPYRWSVTNDAAVPEPLAHGGESYTEERGAYNGAGATLRQLLRHHPDALDIVSEFLAELSDADTEIPMPKVTTLIAGSDLDPIEELDLGEAFLIWARDSDNRAAYRTANGVTLDTDPTIAYTEAKELAFQYAEWYHSTPEARDNAELSCDDLARMFLEQRSPDHRPTVAAPHAGTPTEVQA